MVAVALLGLFVGSPAWGQEDLVGSYKVPWFKTTLSDHRWAIYAVGKSDHGPEYFILSFMQNRGNYEEQLFLCDHATWNKNKQSYSCSKKLENITETMTVGHLDGTFCNDLRNKNEKHKKKIIEQDDCKEEERCSCYEIKHADESPSRDVAPSAGAGTGKGN